MSEHQPPAVSVDRTPKRQSWQSSGLAKTAVAISSVGVALAVIAFILGSSIESGQGTAIGGLAVLGAAAVTFYGTHLTREQTKSDENNKHQREVMRDLQSRFTTSATQLADDAATIRLAGVYSLASLADDWYTATGSTLASERDRQVCIDVLCAYLRRDTTSDTALYSKLKKSDKAGRTDDLEAEEKIVRAAIITAIRTHTTIVPKDTNDPKWTGADFDLTGAKLDSADLLAVDLATALFPGADLTKATLNGARLNGCNFNGTKFSNGHLNGTQLTGANLHKAHFDGARLDGANFQNAKGHATDFTNTRGDLPVFRGARLVSAKFIRAQFMRAHFEGAYLYDANFEGAELTHASFDGATIDGADFTGVDLSAVSFVDVVIHWDEPVWPDNQRPAHVTVAPPAEFPDPNDD
ncbi:pentapeptide repeat-containing protein [Rhodococcus sp. NPDC080181]|uniref:pentapeptide repeat-containing protein n=1 Tax=Rhodococcus sp. NPDC080181 TaxID=3155292 RepID=UPI00344F3AB4